MGGADRRVALDVLHRRQPGPDGARDVGDRRIPLQVDEVGGQGRRVDIVGSDAPAHHAGVVGHRHHLGTDRLRRRRGPETTDELLGPDPGLAEHGPVVHRSGRRADHRHPVHRPGRDEGAQTVVVLELPAGLTEQVGGRVPAPTDQQGVAVQASAIAQHDAGDPVLTEHRRHPGALADVDDGDDPSARGLQLRQQLDGGPVRGQQHDLAPDQHTEALQELTSRLRQHHSGPVVVGEGDRALVGTGGHHDLPGSDPPDPRPGGSCRRCGLMIGPPFQRQQQVVVVERERRGPGQQGDVRQRGQLGGRLGDPGGDGHERPAGGRPLVDQDHAQPGPGRDQRRDHPGRTGPDHCHVDVHVHAVVAGQIGLRAQPAPSRQSSGHQSLDQLDSGRESHRLRVRCLDVDQRARVLRTGRDDTARPVQTHAVSEHGDPVGQQCTGQGVAGVAGASDAVEGELDRPGPIQLRTVRGDPGAPLIVPGAHLIVPGAHLACPALTGSPGPAGRVGRSPGTGGWRCPGPR